MESSAIVYEERKGGTTPNSFPHACIFFHAGATKDQCGGITIMFQRNNDGCRRFNCNASTRKCYMCTQEARMSKSNPVRDPKIGLCEEHEAALRNPAPPPVRLRAAVPPRRNDTNGEKKVEQPSNNREEDVPFATAAECERLRHLNADERFVLSKFAYGYDPASITPMLAKQRRVTGDSVHQLLNSTCRKLDLGEIEKERDRLQKAGKIWLDAREREQEQGTGRIYTEPEADADPDPAPAEAHAAEDDIDDSQPDEAAPIVEEEAEPEIHAEEVLEPEEAEAMRSPERAAAEAVAKKWIAAKRDGGTPPPIDEVYGAVQVMLGDDMTQKEVGVAFGQTETSAASWTSMVANLSRLSKASWSLVKGKQASINMLKQAAGLEGDEQIEKIREWLRKKDGGDEPAPARAPKAGRAERPARETASLPAPVAASAPVAPSASNGNANGHSNGHGLASLLPVRISLRDLGHFTDVDLAPISLGAEASAERSKCIADHRAQGFEPAEIVMHPALPSAQMLFTKSG